VAVLTPSDVDQVVSGRIEPVTRAGGRVAEGDATPFGAALQKDHVAPVGIDVHLLGIEREEAEFRRTHRRTPSRTTVESASFGPELIWRVPVNEKPASSASTRMRSGLTRWSTSSWMPRSIPPRGST